MTKPARTYPSHTFRDFFLAPTKHNHSYFNDDEPSYYETQRAPINSWPARGDKKVMQCFEFAYFKTPKDFELLTTRQQLKARKALEGQKISGNFKVWHLPTAPKMAERRLRLVCTLCKGNTKSLHSLGSAKGHFYRHPKTVSQDTDTDESEDQEHEQDGEGGGKGKRQVWVLSDDEYEEEEHAESKRRRTGRDSWSMAQEHSQDAEKGERSLVRAEQASEEPSTEPTELAWRLQGGKISFTLKAKRQPTADEVAGAEGSKSTAVTEPQGADARVDKAVRVERNADEQTTADAEQAAKAEEEAASPENCGAEQDDKIAYLQQLTATQKQKLAEWEKKVQLFEQQAQDLAIANARLAEMEVRLSDKEAVEAKLAKSQDAEMRLREELSTYQARFLDLRRILSP
ncbi:hypothetical protein OC845_005753 [Tilletia horrida]|nr:hypothetical protein OC845_005753 [Tilletia horrida]